ncbi:MAG TPA: GAF domain-containing SpoIIE family protein phosphatase [Solirubrobacteraceae bacterium]|nr:GAF domain-containing SpoIIE family protein phosphatase [Solirubrobacteraceae bacterium]
MAATRHPGEAERFAALLHEVEELRRAVEVKDLLISASAAFDASLDPLQTMRTIADTAVPRLADMCVIDLVREDGTIGDSVVAARDGEVGRRLEELRAREPLHVSGAHPVARALRSGEPVWVHDLTDPATLDEAAQSEEHMRFMRGVGYRAGIVIKLTARGHVLGALSFLRVSEDRDFDPEHLPLMQDLANRAAMALDNANLYAERTHVARILQRGLLPDALPEVAGLQLASAYHPVGEGNEVGGDFYDVFEVPSGCWLVVGDVCGKGVEAAAVTALVRHSIRALALHEGSPAEVLRYVNEAMLSHELAGRFATVVLVRLDLSSGASVGATIAGAGHPPPVVLDADGRAWCPEVTGTLLGVHRQARSRDVMVTLQPGASVVLFTDGLTEAGAPRGGIEAEEICRHLAHDGSATQSGTAAHSGSVAQSGLAGHGGLAARGGSMAGGGSAVPRELVRRLEELARERSAGPLRDDIAIVAARVLPR